jgi:hypothetical protein
MKHLSKSPKFAKKKVLKEMSIRNGHTNGEFKDSGLTIILIVGIVIGVICIFVAIALH